MDGNTTESLGPIPTQPKVETAPPRNRWWNEEKPKAKRLLVTEDGVLLDRYGRAYTRDIHGTIRRIKENE